MIVDNWIEREVSQGGVARDTDHLRWFCVELAQQLLATRSQRLGAATVLRTAAWNGVDLTKCGNSGPSLLQKLENGRWSFVHPSVGEFLIVQEFASKESCRPQINCVWTTQMTAFAREILHSPGDRYLKGARLEQEDLDGIVARGLALPGAHLAKLRLSRLDLRGIVLDYADLRECDLSHADLADASLKHADLRGAHLAGVNLVGASLEGADLSAQVLSALDLTGVSLRQAKLTDADLSGLDLSRHDLADAALTGAKLVGTVFAGAHLDRVDLSGRDFSGQDLEGVNLTEAKLSGTRFVGACLRGAELTRALLIGVDLSAADLRGANLTGASLFEVNLTNAKLDEGQLGQAARCIEHAGGHCELPVRVRNYAGLHARASVKVVQIAAHYKSDIKLASSTGTCNAKSVMGIACLVLSFGRNVTIVSDGPDAFLAAYALADAFEKGFGEGTVD